MKYILTIFLLVPLMALCPKTLPAVKENDNFYILGLSGIMCTFGENEIMSICKRCNEAEAKHIGLCGACYKADLYGRKTRLENKKERNFIRDGVGILTDCNGVEFMVDLDVFEWAKNHLWSNSGAGYAKTSGLGNGPQYLHKILKPEFKIVDHKNRNTFDCRKDNLRDGSAGVNGMNKTFSIKSKSGVRGVFPQKKKWCVRIMSGKNRIWLGLHYTVEDARQALLKYAKENNLEEYYT